jgi:8-amino-7-oxononanoate synthase
VESLGCTGRPIVQMGTLSKAIGSLGGYVTGAANVIDFLRQRAPSWIYTTGLSPADTAAALAAIDIINTEPERRDRLWDNIRYAQQQLAQIPRLQCLPTMSAIVCIAMPDVPTALAVSQQLQNGGIFALAIRPPTVPTSRIRLTLMATHTHDHIDRLAAILRTTVPEGLE